MIDSTYDKKLLEMALSQLVLWNFTGRPKQKIYNWFVGWCRRLLRMKPEYEYAPLPISKSKTIKFRKYQPLGTLPDKDRVMLNKAGLPYTEMEIIKKYNDD